MIDRFERRGLGRLDTANFGLWLNIDPVVASHLGPKLSSLTMSTFHFPLQDDHREFVDALKDEDLALALNCFTMFAHERRHFHDLLATPYGSVLMRQYTRAGLLTLACQHDLYFRSNAIAVPLADWVTNMDLFTLAHAVEPPSDNLRQLHETFSVMQKKLDLFNSGTIALPGPFVDLDATAILEGLAILTQEHEIARTFGPDKVGLFRETFRGPQAEMKYYDAIAFCASVLGPEVSQEVLTYCLVASLCGNFQDENPDTPRYPIDLLARLLMWLKEERFDGSALQDFEEFVEVVDSFFEETCGDDLQGMVILAARANEQVSESFSEMVEQYEEAFGTADHYPRQVFGVFENFRDVQGPFAANVAMNPLWYVGAAYCENVASLPAPVIFIECEAPYPVDRLGEHLYYIQTESRIDLAEFPPELAAQAERHADDEGVIRGVHIMSPRAQSFKAPDGKYPLRFQFEVPEIDVDLWQKSFDALGATLRFLLEGDSEGMIKPLLKTILLGFGIHGTHVYSVAGELEPPPIPDDPDSPAIDPEIRKRLADDQLRDFLRELRKSKKSEPST